MTLREIDHVPFLVEHAQTFFAGEIFREEAAGLGLGVRFKTKWTLDSEKGNIR